MALLSNAKVILGLHKTYANDANTELIDDLIEEVTSAAEGFCNRKLLLGEYTEEISGDNGTLISVNAAPLWTVESVKLKRVGGLYTLSELTYNVDKENGLLRCSKWPAGTGNIEVTYTAGWDEDEVGKEPPADLRGAIRDEVMARFLVFRSQPRVGDGLVDLTTDFLNQKSEKVLLGYRLNRL